MLSVTAALFYSIASARLLVALGRGRQTVSAPHSGPYATDRSTPGAPQTSSRSGGMADGIATGMATGVATGSKQQPGQRGELLAESTGSSTHGKSRKLTLGIAAVALCLHVVVARSLTGWPDSFHMPFLTALAVTAIGVVSLQLALCIRQPADYLGLAVYPTSAVFLLASMAAGEGHTVHGHAIQVHILLSVLAYAVLALAAAQAAMVSIQRHHLQTHRPGGYLRALPPLETTEQLLFALLGAGFVLLTLSLGSGFFYLEDMFAQSLVHKTVLSSMAWLIFGLLLFGRWRFGWRGRRAVHLTLAGFAVLILAYFGSKLVLELVLGRG